MDLEQGSVGPLITGPVIQRGRRPAGAYFGAAVAVNDICIAVAAPDYKSNKRDSYDVGRVYIFKAGKKKPEYTLDPPAEIISTAKNPYGDLLFGQTLALGSDFLVVGVDRGDDPDRPAAIVYHLSTGKRAFDIDLDSGSRGITSMVAAGNKLAAMAPVGAEYPRGYGYSNPDIKTKRVNPEAFVYDLESKKLLSRTQCAHNNFLGFDGETIVLAEKDGTEPIPSLGVFDAQSGKRLGYVPSKASGQAISQDGVVALPANQYSSGHAAWLLDMSKLRTCPE